ncbi:MAG: sulfatase-like hydrolase/transferase [Planctomycetota bacterium]|nr:sulfatase-like hydrolase/transferase [Planctomycetota bacterium]
MTKYFKMTLGAGVGLLIIYAIMRAAFLFVHREYFVGVPTTDIAMAFVHALRFDLAGLIILNIPVMILLNAPLPQIKPRWWKRITFVIFALANTAGFLLNLADLGYYPNVQRRIIFEPFDQTEHLLVCFPGWVEEFPLLIFGGFAVLGLLMWMLAIGARRLDRAFEETTGIWRTHIWAAVLIVICGLGIRGGLQDGIMRPADAFSYSTHTAVGDLTLNSTYTVLLNGFLPSFPVMKSMPEDEAVGIARALVSGRDDTWLDAAHPFLRETKPEGEPRKLNVVILMQESWTAANVGPDEKGISRTPHFDALAAQGALFTNFLATSQRSSEAVPSVITAVPAIFRRPIIGSRIELVRYRGMGDILREHGYTCSFHHGASPTIEGFRGFSKLAGFHHYYSRDDYDGEEEAEERNDGKWGIFDHLFYRHAARTFDAVDGPFAGVIFGLSPHDPYRIPPSLAKQFETDTGDTAYQRHLRYSDYALHQFFEYARTRPWFENTIFLITADHTRFAPPGSLYESFHVPLLVYAPGLVEPAVRSELTSHVDMLPTVIDLLRLPTTHASMGLSVFDQAHPHRAVVKRSGRYVIFGETYALQSDLHGTEALYAYKEDSRFETDLAAKHPEVFARLSRELHAWLQGVSTAVVEDRMWPAAR